MIEEFVCSSLRTVIAQVHPLVLPQESAYPAITYQNITDVPHNHLKGSSSTVNARVQVDIWAKSYKEAKDLYQSVKSAMSGSLVLGTNEFYEKETRLYRVSIDFSVWQ